MWDTEYGNPHFVIGYYDRVFKRIVREVMRNGELVWSRPGPG